jgi:hypothetical protein
MYFLVESVYLHAASHSHPLAPASPLPAHHHEPVRLPYFPPRSLPPTATSHYSVILIHSFIHTPQNEPESPLIQIAAMYNYSKKKKRTKIGLCERSKKKQNAARTIVAGHRKKATQTSIPFLSLFFIQTYKHSIVKCPQFPSRSRQFMQRSANTPNNVSMSIQVKSRSDPRPNQYSCSSNSQRSPSPPIPGIEEGKAPEQGFETTLKKHRRKEIAKTIRSNTDMLYMVVVYEGILFEKKR